MHSVVKHNHNVQNYERMFFKEAVSSEIKAVEVSGDEHWSGSVTLVQ